MDPDGVVIVVIDTCGDIQVGVKSVEDVISRDGKICRQAVVERKLSAFSRLHSEGLRERKALYGVGQGLFLYSNIQS